MTIIECRTWRKALKNHDIVSAAIEMFDIPKENKNTRRIDIKTKVSIILYNNSIFHRSLYLSNKLFYPMHKHLLISAYDLVLLSSFLTRSNHIQRKRGNSCDSDRFMLVCKCCQMVSCHATLFILTSNEFLPYDSKTWYINANMVKIY